MMGGLLIKTGKNIKRSVIIEQIFDSLLLVSDEEAFERWLIRRFKNKSLLGD